MSAGDLRPGINKIIYRDGQVFYLYLPRSASAGDGALRLLASIHGYSGQSASASGRARVKKAAERWAAHAETHGWIVLAPQFDEDRFAGEWQRLNLFGLRADHRLQALIRATKNLAPRLKTDRILLFGFSGGGQFVHRYAAFHPDRVVRAVAAGAGWYLWPDDRLPYPVGAAPGSLPGNLRPKLRTLCRRNLLILAGAEDTTQGVYRSRYKGIDLQSLQGAGRRERAERWFSAMKAFASERGEPFTLSLEILPRTKHTTTKKLIEVAGNYLSKTCS